MNAEKERDLYKLEPARLAYMVAWRDRYIKALEERVQGMEEQKVLLEALLLCALADGAVPCEDGSREILLTRNAVSEVIRSCETVAEPCEEGYRIRFIPVSACGEGADGTKEKEGA
jgi:hypothetical protein